jgi:hypothetical protein
MKGGNLEKALADAIGYSNRLSALQKAHPELFQPGGPADPTSPVTQDLTLPPFVEPSVAPETPPVAIPEVQLNWAEITAEVDRIATEQDDVCRSLTQQWIVNDREIKKASEEIKSKQSRLGYLDSLLKDNAIELPELRAEEFKDERRTLLSEIGLLKQDAMLRALQNKELDQSFTQRRALIYDHIVKGRQAEAQEQAFTAELQQIEASEFQRLSQAWPGALARAIADNKIPQDLVADFGSYAKQVANAAVSNPDFDFADVDGFVAAVGKGYMERLDRYHRAQAAQYGSLAVARATSPSPAPPPGTPAPVAPNPQTMTPEEAIMDAERYLRQRLRG